jgi:L-alanine-DL-glutamate epimerase-like enolase superfamily enzyme
MAFHNRTLYTGLRRVIFGRSSSAVTTAIESLYADGLFTDPICSCAEMACWDLLGKLCGQPLYRLLGGMVREPRGGGVLHGNSNAGRRRRLPGDAAAGFGTLKMKGGRRAEEDLGMVRAIREAVGQAEASRRSGTGYSRKPHCNWPATSSRMTGYFNSRCRMT